MHNVTATMVIETHEGSLTHFDRLIDGAGNVFTFWQMALASNSNQTYVYAEMKNSQGQFIDTWHINPTNEFKIDTALIEVVGGDIHINLSTHHISSEPGRAVRAEEYIIRGVFVPISGGGGGGLTHQDVVTIINQSTITAH